MFLCLPPKTFQSLVLNTHHPRQSRANPGPGEGPGASRSPDPPPPVPAESPRRAPTSAAARAGSASGSRLGGTGAPGGAADTRVKDRTFAPSPHLRHSCASRDPPSARMRLRPPFIFIPGEAGPAPAAEAAAEAGPPRPVPARPRSRGMGGAEGAGRGCGWAVGGAKAGELDTDGAQLG